MSAALRKTNLGGAYRSLLRDQEEADMNPSQRMEQSKNIQQQQNHCDDYNAIQNGLDGSRIGMNRFTSHRTTPTTTRASSLEQRHDL